MPNKGTSKHLNSVQYFTLFVQSESQIYIFTGPNPRLCVHCSSAQQSCRAELIPLQLRKWCALNPFARLPSFFPWKLPQRHPRSAMSITCFLTCQRRVPFAEIDIYLQMLHIYIYIIYIIYIYTHIYIYTNTHVCFTKRIEGDSWLYIMLEYCHSGFPRYVMIYIYMHIIYQMS